MPQTDFIKLVASHAVAVVACIGGPILITYIFLNASDIEGAAGFIALLAGFVGMSFQFLYQTNTQGAARSQTRNDLMENPPVTTGGTP